MGVAKCVCCCRRMGRAVTSNRWWERPLLAELVAFLDASTPPVYVGFGSMAMQARPEAHRPGDHRGASRGQSASSCWSDIDQPSA